MEQVKNLIFQNDNFTFYAVALALTLTVVNLLVEEQRAKRPKKAPRPVVIRRGRR